MKSQQQISDKLMEVNSELINITEAIRVCDNEVESETYHLIADRLIAQRQVLNWILSDKAFNPIITKQ